MKISKKINEVAVELFDSNPSWTELWVNKKGDFFTISNLAANSVKGKKADYARILKSDVVSEQETKDKKEDLNTAIVNSEGMVIVTDDAQKLVFPEIKNEIREPSEGDVATVADKAAEGAYKYQGSTLVFREGKLTKITFKDNAPHSFFKKLLS